MAGYAFTLATILSGLFVVGCGPGLSTGIPSKAPITPLTAPGQSGVPEPGVPAMDLEQYYSELVKARGQLPQSVCAMDLRIRPALRDQVLAQKHDYSWFTAPERYSDNEKKIDETWAEDQRRAIQSARDEIQNELARQGITASPWTNPQDRHFLSALGLYPGFYDPKFYASYQIGPVQMPWYKPEGYVYKVFFELKSPQTDLTPRKYREFSEKLKDAGFEGDTKIPLMAGWARFLWNDIIVHAPSAPSAAIAEKVGLSYFGSSLSSHSRGVDVMNQLTHDKPMDWPDFLCAVGPDVLPENIVGYLHPTNRRP